MPKLVPAGEGEGRRSGQASVNACLAGQREQRRRDGRKVGPSGELLIAVLWVEDEERRQVDEDQAQAREGDLSQRPAERAGQLSG